MSSKIAALAIAVGIHALSGSAVYGEEKPEVKVPPKVAEKPVVKPVVKETVAPVPAAPVSVAAPEALANPAYHLELARVHLNFGVLDQAEPLFRKALELTDKPELKYQVWQSLASLLLRKAEFKEAEQIMLLAVKAAPESDRPRMFFSLADIHEAAKDFSAAETLLLELANEQKVDPNTAWARGEAYRRLMRIWQLQPGRIDQVIADSEKIAAQDPKNTRELEKLIAIYSSGAGDPLKAIVAYERMLAVKPDKELTQGLAMMYVRTQQAEKAAAMYEKLMENGSEAEVRQYSWQSAQVLLQAGKKEPALLVFKKWVKGATTQPEMLQAAGFYEQAGAVDEAEQLYLKVAAAAPSPKEKADLLLRTADMFNTQKQPEKAEKQIRAVLRENKDDKAIIARANAALFRLLESQNRLGELKFDY